MENSINIKTLVEGSEEAKNIVKELMASHEKAEQLVRGYIQALADRNDRVAKYLCHRCCFERMSLEGDNVSVSYYDQRCDSHDDYFFTIKEIEEYYRLDEGYRETYIDGVITGRNLAREQAETKRKEDYETKEKANRLADYERLKKEFGN